MILFKKLLRTFLHYKAQFISMILMIFLGAGIFLGFNGEWYSLKENGNRFFDETNLADYWIYNTTSSFSEADLNKVLEIEGLDDASRRLVAEVTTSITNKNRTLSLIVDDSYKISTNHIVSGVPYQSDKLGFYMSDKFASANNLNIGDTLTLNYEGKTITSSIVSLIKNPEYLYAVQDENQVMPDYSSYGYVYASPSLFKASLGFEYYNQIIVDTSMDKVSLENLINEALQTTLLVLSHDENASIQMLNGEIEEGKTMGNLLPVVFLAIAILGMITTMHRITTNEKSQIGILKALGFRNRKILRHYTSFGTIVGFLGCLIAIPLGIGVAALIVNPNFFEGTCFDMPYWNISIPSYCYLILVVIVLFVTFIAYISTRKILFGSASETLRPYTPKKVKPLKIEKTKLWKKFSFSTKWNLRDLSRSKSRTIMGFIGVLGCMVLLIAAFGMKDTMSNFMNNLDQKVLNFDYKVILNEAIDLNLARNLRKEINGDSVASTSIRLEENNYSLEIYNNAHDYIRIIDQNDKIVFMEDDGAYICTRIADKYHLKENDKISFSLYGEAYTYQVTIKQVIKSSMNEAIFLSEKYASTIKNENNQSLNDLIPISYILTDTEVDKEDSSLISNVQLKTDVMDSYDSFMEIMNFMVAILVLFAVLLGFVVMYNLGAISYIEKYRELATLKVVGFKNKKIGSLLIKQNIWITIVGIIIGIPVGYGLLHFLIVMLGSEYELTTTVNFISVVICSCLTIVTSLFTNLFISRKNKSIDMVESLKMA